MESTDLRAAVDVEGGSLAMHVVWASVVSFEGER